MTPRIRLAGRSAFTLTEVLIVIAILSVLAALLLAAVSKVRDAGSRTVAAAEISQLEMAAQTFKNKHGFFPPQAIQFPGNSGQETTDLQQKTGRYFRQMFRAYDPAALGSLLGVNYRFNGRVIKATDTLAGVESLAFFLGGPELNGFKPNTPFPAQATDTSKVGPYFEFNPERFLGTDSYGEIGFRDGIAYRDPWGTPYAYFSTGQGSAYAAAAEFSLTAPGGTLNAFKKGTAANAPWANPSGVQIVSAGPDTQFGSNAGGWTPGAGAYTDAGLGADDLSNFNSGTQLGVAGK